MLLRAYAWIDAHERVAIVGLISVAIVLRALLVIEAPTPQGYVWDFYSVGVRVLYEQGRLPVADDCWQCYHPPLFYLIGWPFYAVGRLLTSGPDEALALRFLAAVPLLSAAVTIYYGDRLLRLTGARGASRVMGIALLLALPCLFISSYAPEGDIVLTAIMSAFIFHLTRIVAAPPPARLRDALQLRDALLLGVLAGLAAATKYSGLVAIVTAGVMYGLRVLAGPRRVAAVRDGLIVLVIAATLGGYKYVTNVATYGTPLFANGSAVQGFSVSKRETFPRNYEFSTFRLGQLSALNDRRPPLGELTSLPVYRSVFTSIHAQAWTDMSMFSEPSRHGDPGRLYPRKLIPWWLTMSVIVLGLLPEALALAGIAVTRRQRIFRPLVVVSLVTMGTYVWWVLSQPSWGLKTKYILFLALPGVVFAMQAISWLQRRWPRAGAAVFALLALLVVLANAYDLMFAIR